MNTKFKVGDFIRILPENRYCNWYTDEIFQILDINEYSELYTISIKLKSTCKIKNTIWFGNVYQDSECRKMLRKLKLEKIFSY